LIVYGIGDVGKWLIHYIYDCPFTDVIAISDSNYDKYKDSIYNVIAPNEINKLKYDYI